MEENLDLRKALVDARLAVKDLPRTGNGDTIEAYWEVCCGDVLVAEENLREQRRLWENSALAEEFLDIAEYLEGFDHKLDGLNQAVQRMTDAVYEHPALKLRLLMFRQLVLSRIESLHGCELGASEDVHAQICLYERNIEHADNGEYDLVEQEGHLKRDPVEWSSAYEKVIDVRESHRRGGAAGRRGAGGPSARDGLLLRILERQEAYPARQVRNRMAKPLGNESRGDFRLIFISCRKILKFI